MFDSKCGEELLRKMGVEAAKRIIQIKLSQGLGVPSLVTNDVQRRPDRGGRLNIVGRNVLDVSPDSRHNKKTGLTSHLSIDIDVDSGYLANKVNKYNPLRIVGGSGERHSVPKHKQLFSIKVKINF
ncbi:MAG: hypothetical protein ACR2RL_24040 [Gammaproteobacteria bacterium]